VGVATVIADLADWETLRSRPTIAEIEVRTGLSRRCVQYHCQRLERNGWLVVLEPGTTPQFRPGALHRDDANLAKEWRLTTPVRSEATRSCTPSPTPNARKPYAGAREVPPRTSPGQEHLSDGRYAPDSTLLAPPLQRAQAIELALRAKPQRRGEQLAVCEILRRRSALLAQMSARRLRSKLRVWFGSKYTWTPAGILAAIDRPREGPAHRYAGRVRSAEALLDHRLSFWLGPDGLPGPAPRDGLADRDRRQAAERSRPADPVTDPGTMPSSDDRPGSAGREARTATRPATDYAGPSASGAATGQVIACEAAGSCHPAADAGSLTLAAGLAPPQPVLPVRTESFDEALAAAKAAAARAPGPGADREARFAAYRARLTRPARLQDAAP
jgi:hypothetical protein